MFNKTQIIKASVFALVLGTVTVAQAANPLVCSSGVSPTGGSSSITISQKDGISYVKGFAQGGRAHFVTGFGPYAAKEEVQGDTVTYTWEDQFHQFGTVTVLTSIGNGTFSQTATSNFGLWQNQILNCK